MSTRKHVQEITSKHHAYSIGMGGAIDGERTRGPAGYEVYDQAFEPNVYVRVENVGDTPVVNPWLVANGRDWRAVESIVEGVLDPGMDQEERAIALWDFLRSHRFHTTPRDADNRDPVKMLNVYGYTLCGEDAGVLADLWRAVGLKVRAGHPVGYNTSEVFYNGKWHLLDCDENVFCLLRDNRTIAGEEDIVRDHDLMNRTHTYGILRWDHRGTDEFSASLYAFEGERSQEMEPVTGHRMELTLRPAEALVWRWDGKCKHHGRDGNPGEKRMPPGAWNRICNGELVYSPDVASDLWRYGAVEIRNVAPEGPPVSTGTGDPAVVFEVKSPYVIVGGRIRGRSVPRSMGERTALEVSFDCDDWVEVWSSGALGAGVVDVCLDRLFPPDGLARYGYFVRLSFEGGKGAAPEISRLTLQSDLQMAPLSLPGLRLGTNEMVYLDETQGRRCVRITHEWRERSTPRPPSAQERPVFPEDGADAEGTMSSFRWVPASDPQGRAIVDYHFQLSRRSDMKYVLSPNFEKLVSRTAERGQAAYRIPHEGLLNPGETYFWRVRGRNDEGVWSPWSPVWRFVPQGPGVPLGVATAVDRKRRSITLSWRANPEGRDPETYEVYGSNEKGFTASPEPHPVSVPRKMVKDPGTRSRPVRWRMPEWVEGLLPQEVHPPNLVARVTACHLEVSGDGVDLPNAGSAFYRVVAVDASGVRSGPSDYAGVPRPHSRLPSPQGSGSRRRLRRIRTTPRSGVGMN